MQNVMSITDKLNGMCYYEELLLKQGKAARRMSDTGRAKPRVSTKIAGLPEEKSGRR